MFTYVFVFAIVTPFKGTESQYSFREGFRGVIKASAVSIRLLKLLPRPLSDRWSLFSGLYAAAEADFDDYKVDFLGEFESILETALAPESGP
jgi:hypothetical protein